ncbi:MAG: ArdC-like ssDNA-binding domain-containing protein [Planctomycetota bacterium]
MRSEALAKGRQIVGYLLQGSANLSARRVRLSRCLCFSNTTSSSRICRIGRHVVGGLLQPSRRAVFCPRDEFGTHSGQMQDWRDRGTLIVPTKSSTRGQPMISQSDIRKHVTDEIVSMMEQGVAPWRRPWIESANSGSPTNIVSKNPYHGVNPMLLNCSAMRRGFSSKWWGTFRQWQSLGGHVKARPADIPPGQWGTKIILYRPIMTIKTDAEGNEKESTFPLLRQFTVFNSDQVSGLDQFQAQPASSAILAPDFAPAEEAILATRADIRHAEGNRAAYCRPPHDFIMMPLKSQFVDGLGIPGYYDTVFHELCHWTEHRLGWTGSYSLGELRAELGAVYVMGEVGVQADSSLFRNNVNYLADQGDESRPPCHFSDFGCGKQSSRLHHELQPSSGGRKRSRRSSGGVKR